VNKQDAINIFIETVYWPNVIKRWNLPENTPDYFASEEFITYWRQNPEIRPGQVLVNLGLIPDGDQQWDDTYLSLLTSCRKANDGCIRHD